MSNTNLKPLTHETEIEKIDTRFYWFRGPWGEHEIIVVDAQTGNEYEIVNRSPNIRPVTEDRIIALAQWVQDGRPAHPAKPGYHSRQCFHHGLGYNPIAL